MSKSWMIGFPSTRTTKCSRLGDYPKTNLGRFSSWRPGSKKRAPSRPCSRQSLMSSSRLSAFLDIVRSLSRKRSSTWTAPPAFKKSQKSKEKNVFPSTFPASCWWERPATPNSWRNLAWFPTGLDTEFSRPNSSWIRAWWNRVSREAPYDWAIKAKTIFTKFVAPCPVPGSESTRSSQTGRFSSPLSTGWPQKSTASKINFLPLTMRSVKSSASSTSVLSIHQTNSQVHLSRTAYRWISVRIPNPTSFSNSKWVLQASSISTSNFLMIQESTRAKGILVQNDTPTSDTSWPSSSQRRGSEASSVMNTTMVSM